MQTPGGGGMDPLFVKRVIELESMSAVLVDDLAALCALPQPPSLSHTK